MNKLQHFLTEADYINTSDSERVVSATSGLALIGVALVTKNQSNLAKWFKIISGALLIARAASGFCPLNKALGIDHSRQE
jgi:uncharacterized membrane protein